MMPERHGGGTSSAGRWSICKFYLRRADEDINPRDREGVAFFGGRLTSPSGLPSVSRPTKRENGTSYFAATGRKKFLTAFKRV